MASSAGLRRQNSARDKSKPLPNISGPSPRNTTSHLVVCGAVEAKDVWLFGDFLGFTSALREQSRPINGTFLNCFDLETYFGKTAYKDVKFGLREEVGDDNEWDSGDEIVIYTRFEFEHRTRWWEQLDQEERQIIILRVLEWIRTRTQETKPGDIVSIILIGHGNLEGIILGGKTFKPADLAAACSLFAPDIQVNIVIKACYSGAFTDAFKVSNQRNIYVHTSAKAAQKSYSTRLSISGRLRNSLFGDAFIQTLGLMRDPDERWTLEKQSSFVKERLNKSTILLTRRSEPQVVSDSPKTRLMMNIMDRDYVDVTFSQAPVHARRVLTPQNESLPLLRQSARKINNITAAEFEAASEVITYEMSLINTDYPEHGDFDVIPRWFSRKLVPPHNQAEATVQVAQALAYRFKIQERFLVIAEHLIRAELLSIDALYTPMDLFRYSRSVETVLKALQCFPLVHECMDHHSDGLGQEFQAPARWLATVIVRSCADWTRILNWLCTIQMLGTPDIDRIRELSHKGLKIAVNPKELESKEVKPRQFGFWLPEGVKIRDMCETWSTRYLSVKRVYESLTGSEWPDYDIVESSMAMLLEIERESTP
jgi:hypothetical protein